MMHMLLHVESVCDAYAITRGRIWRIIVCRGNSGSIMDLENRFHYTLKEEQSHDGMLSTSLRFATFPKEEVIQKPHAILFVCPDRMTTRSVQGFFSEVH